MAAWAIRVPYFRDESLSSWLARAALDQGCDPLVLTGAIWPKWRIWTLDPDRGIGHDRLRALSEASGIQISVFASASLRATMERVAGRSLPLTTTWPWLLALGSRNRKHKGGLQFCPACMSEDKEPYFRRRWRFAWHMGCATHGARLLDRCHVCRSPVEPHRLAAEDRHIALCATCRSDLRAAPLVPARPGALAFQRAAENMVGGGSGAFGGRLVTASEWFALARFLIGLIRRADRGSSLANALGALGVHIGEGTRTETGLPLELLPVVEREALTENAFHVMGFGRDALVKALRNAGLSANALHGGRGPLPAPAREIVAALPHKQRTRRACGKDTVRPRSKRSVMKAWARLRRKMLAEVRR